MFNHFRRREPWREPNLDSPENNTQYWGKQGVPVDRRLHLNDV